MKVGDLVKLNRMSRLYNTEHAHDIGLITKVKPHGKAPVSCYVLWNSTNHQEIEWLEELEVVSESR